MLSRKYIYISLSAMMLGFELLAISVTAWASLPPNAFVLISGDRAELVCGILGNPCPRGPVFQARLYGSGKTAVYVVDRTFIRLDTIETQTFRIEMSNSSVCLTPYPSFYAIPGVQACPDISVPPYLSLGWFLLVIGPVMAAGGGAVLASYIMIARRRIRPTERLE